MLFGQRYETLEAFFTTPFFNSPVAETTDYFIGSFFQEKNQMRGRIWATTTPAATYYSIVSSTPIHYEDWNDNYILCGCSCTCKVDLTGKVDLSGQFDEDENDEGSEEDGPEQEECDE
ncbi:hypothetical protein TWF506_002084 [Arthrobotrys conoides]|uniref:Uncharacterized protein n=1 Tax=Arthrobotrys conoides TaxID=74498 RepID=A0AAN8RZ46_9PEZI